MLLREPSGRIEGKYSGPRQHSYLFETTTSTHAATIMVLGVSLIHDLSKRLSCRRHLTGHARHRNLFALGHRSSFQFSPSRLRADSPLFCSEDNDTIAALLWFGCCKALGVVHDAIVRSTLGQGGRAFARHTQSLSDAAHYGPGDG